MLSLSTRLLTLQDGFPQSVSQCSWLIGRLYQLKSLKFMHFAAWTYGFDKSSEIDDY